MSKKVLFITMPYTGTRFFLNILTPILGKPAKISEYGQPFYHHHTTRGNLPRFTELVLRERCEVVTTHRPYDDMIASWHRRFGDSKQKALELEAHIDMYEQWVLPLASLVLSFQPGIRETSLECLNNFFNTSVTTNWTPIGHYE